MLHCTSCTWILFVFTKFNPSQQSKWYKVHVMNKECLYVSFQFNTACTSVMSTYIIFRINCSVLEHFPNLSYTNITYLKHKRCSVWTSVHLNDYFCQVTLSHWVEFHLSFQVMLWNTIGLSVQWFTVLWTTCGAQAGPWIPCPVIRLIFNHSQFQSPSPARPCHYKPRLQSNFVLSHRKSIRSCLCWQCAPSIFMCCCWAANMISERCVIHPLWYEHMQGQHM